MNTTALTSGFAGASALAGQASFESKLNTFRENATAQATRLEDINSLKSEDEKLRTVSKEFASVMLGMMFKEMTPNQKADGLGFGGSGEEIFRDMQTDNYSRIVADNDAPGSLANIVYNALVDKTTLAARANAASAAYASAHSKTNPTDAASENTSKTNVRTSLGSTGGAQ